jgi:hypothetical protein
MKYTVILLVLSIVVARIAAYRSSFPRRVAKRIGLKMGGYYAEAESEEGSEEPKEEIGGRKIDRSKTHMIFGVRCIETKHKVSVATSASASTTVVGLQPLNDLEEQSSDGTICNDDVEEGKTLSIVLDHLLSENPSDGRSNVIQIVPSGDDDDDHDPHHHAAFELVEVGADPIVSLAAARLLSESTGSKRIDRSVVVRHPNEQRLRVLEHAHMFFNERTKNNPCSFRTEPLQDNEPLVGWPPASAHSISNANCVVLFTSPALVSSRLDEAVTGILAPRVRVLVPSAIISPTQLEGFEYRVVAGDKATKSPDYDSESPLLLEILSRK